MHSHAVVLLSRRSRELSCPFITVALATAMLALLAGPAAAHEGREVDRFTFVVGFVQEPAFSHIPNAVDLRISETGTGEPYVDLTDTLEVDVIFGDETLTLPIRPFFRVDTYGTPGEYGAWFVPSRPGQYTFRFHGTIDDVEIDEEFVSGPETFNDVDDISAAMFPAQDSSLGELNERLEREVQRLNARVDELGGEDADVEPATAAEGADGEADWVARGLGIVALLVGAGAGGVALTQRTP